MKLTYTIILSLFFISIELFGQTLPPKYVLIEHFTNTRCSTCASRNPAFFDVIHAPENEGKIHHIAIHPPYPYTQCAFYQHNTNDNLSRTEFYGVLGTPRAYVRGSRNAEGSQLLSQGRLDTFWGETSPIEVIVSETDNTTNGSRIVEVKINNYEAIEASEDLKLYVALVEKEVNYNAPNGEDEHFNVFRKMLPDFNGTDFNPDGAGSSKVFYFNYELNSEWNASEIYPIAFVQNVGTKEVINSGSPFDPIFTDIEESVLDKNINLYPNPASDFIHLELNEQGLNIDEVAIYNNSGALLQSFEGGSANLKIDVRNYPTGIYFVKLKSGEDTIYRKVVVQ